MNFGGVLPWDGCREALRMVELGQLACSSAHAVAVASLEEKGSEGHHGRKDPEGRDRGQPGRLRFQLDPV